MKQTMNLSSWNKGLSRVLKLSTLGIAVLLGASTLAQAAEQLISNNYQRNLRGDQEINLSQELRLDQLSGMVNSVIVVASTALGKGQLQVVLNGQVFSSQQVGQSLQAIQIPVHRELRRDIQDLRIHTMGNFTISMTGVTLDDLSPYNPGPGPVPPFPPPTPNPGQLDCGSGWEFMGTFTCENRQEHQRICGCRPSGYNNPALWNDERNGCYNHVTGRTCRN